ncbi:hypothetical protein [Chitinophaga sp. Cy-1792]|uniref:hypothetical protein n=1 Tax=Chitinophaga sp. Cy-1792 TaxID=2608339 RepID=UPI0014213557|nr:hypothetical protein [Chitinophaga sp. Cy-1792]NIG57742.1 hypothetical protein [Chitinophaga sp. Cy-1792]
MSLKKLESVLIICFVCICSCQSAGSNSHMTDTTFKQLVMPKDTLLQRLSIAVKSLAESKWDSSAIIQAFAATPDRYYVFVSSGKSDTASKNAVVIIPENRYANQFRLHIDLPDTLASQISYDDLNKLFGEPVKDSLGGIPITPPKEPIISYRIIREKDTVNLVTYHTNQVNNARENIYGFRLYK